VVLSLSTRQVPERKLPGRESRGPPGCSRRAGGLSPNLRRLSDARVGPFFPPWSPPARTLPGARCSSRFPPSCPSGLQPFRRLHRLTDPWRASGGWSRGSHSDRPVIMPTGIAIHAPVANCLSRQWITVVASGDAGSKRHVRGCGQGTFFPQPRVGRDGLAPTLCPVCGRRSARPKRTPETKKEELCDPNGGARYPAETEEARLSHPAERDCQAGFTETAVECVLHPGRWLFSLTTRPPYGRTAMPLLRAVLPAIEISAGSVGVWQPRLPAPPSRGVSPSENRRGPGVSPGVPRQSAEVALAPSVKGGGKGNHKGGGIGDHFRLGGR
jgi:hypothetical protein